MKSPVLVARITGAHGLRGDVRLHAFTGDPLAIADYGPLSDSQGTRFEITRLRAVKAHVIAGLAGVHDRDRAEALAGTELFVDRAVLPDDTLDADEIFEVDLLGLAVFDEATHRCLGEVVAVHDFGAGSVLEIRLEGTRRTEMIPLTMAAVPDVDPDRGRITVNRVAAGLDDECLETQRPGKARRRPSRGEKSRP